MDVDITFIDGFSGGVYGFYLICGYLIRRGFLKKCKSIWLILVSLTSYVGVICVQIVAHYLGIEYNVWYNSVFLLISSVCIFELLSRARRIGFRNLIYFISYFSFAVYLIHVLVLSTMEKFLQVFAIPGFFKIMVYFVTVSVISFVLAFFISKIPKIGKLLLYLK